TRQAAEISSNSHKGDRTDQHTQHAVNTETETYNNGDRDNQTDQHTQHSAERNDDGDIDDQTDQHTQHSAERNDDGGEDDRTDQHKKDSKKGAGVPRTIRMKDHSGKEVLLDLDADGHNAIVESTPSGSDYGEAIATPDAVTTLHQNLR
ncbi:hypothetical protein PLICRDRAFT_177270, partial [Plicaturopsis crispa FD-325 SS-3]